MDNISQNTILEIEKLEVVYHNVSTGIQGVSLKVKKDQIVALLGNNGAGKTTTLRAVSGFLGMDNAKVSDGLIRFAGEDIQNKPPHAVAQRGIVMVPEQDKIFENLTVEENLMVSVMNKGAEGKTEKLYDLIFDYFPVLAKLKHRVGGYLSGGERQMLSLATALLCSPRLLLVDELSLGLAPIIVTELMGLIKIIRDELQITVLLVEQNAQAALEIADFCYVMENGRIVFSGDPAKLKGNKEIQEYYLGQGERETTKSYRDVKQYRRTQRLYG
jgi:branched-chain amino acid transport system ATP-binding protein